MFCTFITSTINEQEPSQIIVEVLRSHTFFISTFPKHSTRLFISLNKRIKLKHHTTKYRLKKDTHLMVPGKTFLHFKRPCPNLAHFEMLLLPFLFRLQYLQLHAYGFTSSEGSAGYGSLVVIVSFWPSASIDWIFKEPPRDLFTAILRSIEALTPAASSFAPSWNITSSRMLNSHIRLSVVPTFLQASLQYLSLHPASAAFL